MPSVVVVDDFDMARFGIGAFLSPGGRWTVLGAAPSLEEAKLLLTGLSSPPDIILLDIELKGTWGLDLIPWIREKYGNLPGNAARPAVLVYSHFEDYAHINAAFKMGVNGYVCKSQDNTELEEAMHAVLRNEVYLNRNLVLKIININDILLRLTPREQEIFSLVQQGCDNKTIAKKLGVEKRTIENTLSRIYAKTGIKNRRELERL